MEKNLQATEKFLVSQDKKFQEKIEFTKSQGEFFKKVLNPLEYQIQKYHFIIDSFYQLAIQLPNLYKEDAPPKEVTKQAHEWPRLSLLQPIQQPMTQDQIRAACKSIQEDALSDDPDVLPEYTIIDFNEGDQIWNDQTFRLSHSVVDIEVTFDQRLSYDLCLGNRLDATVYIRDKNSLTQAFLKANGADGKEYFFELNHFSILYLLDEDYRDMDKDKQKSESNNKGETEEIPTEDKEADREVGIFTLFNKAKNLMFVTNY